MVNIVEKPEFMNYQQMLQKYDGKYVALRQDNPATTFDEGEVVAYTDKSIENYRAITDYLNTTYGRGAGSITYVSHSVMDDLYVIFRDVQ